MRISRQNEGIRGGKAARISSNIDLSPKVTRTQALKGVERGLDALDADRVRELLGPDGPFA
jgi:hypothetical protein